MTPITIPRAVVEQALEALESLFNWKVDPERGKRCGDAVVALRAALAQQEQEPVAWIQPDHLQKARQAPFLCRVEPTKRMSDFVPIYTAPPRREWQSLTPDAVFASDEIMSANASLGLRIDQLMDLAHAIEQACKERNT
jgi:hypothetical protein